MFICAGSEILTQVKDHDLDVAEIPITARYDIYDVKEDYFGEVGENTKRRRF
jgi:hypothetical protein